MDEPDDGSSSDARLSESAEAAAQAADQAAAQLAESERVEAELGARNEPPAGVAGTEFDTSRYDLRFVGELDQLTPDGELLLAELATDLEKYPDELVAIIATTGEDGDEASDLLSRRRALKIVRSLGALGVDVSRLRPETRRSNATGDGVVVELR